MPTRDTSFRLTEGEILSASQQNENQKDLEAVAESLHGNRIISGMVVSAGTGLAVNITSGTAVIGRHISLPSVTGLSVAGAASSTKWLWLKQQTTYTDSAGVITDTVGTYELTAVSGTPTGDGALLASITCDGSSVTAVDLAPKDWANVWVDRDTYTIGNDLLTADTTTRIVRARMEEVINVGFGGSGAEIADNVYQTIYCPYAFTITGVTLLADVSGSIVIDIWKDTYANHPPTNADTIYAAAPPTITTATKSQDTTLTGWTTSVAAGSVLKFLVESCTTITQCTLALHITRTGS